jgi:hypothetical protein
MRVSPRGLRRHARARVERPVSWKKTAATNALRDDGDHTASARLGNDGHEHH